MGSALAEALAPSPFTLYAYDPQFSEILSSELHQTGKLPQGIKLATSPRELEQNSDIVLLCVKPQDMAVALKNLTGDRRYLSIAAGVSVASISTLLGAPRTKICRVMPNIAALVKCSVSAIYCEEERLFEKSREILTYAGSTMRVTEEEELHLITALCGSGPGFIFFFFNAMAEAAQQAGMEREKAFQQTGETFRGALELLKDNYSRAKELLAQVVSPKGTTAAGLASLQENRFEEIVEAALAAARERSRQLQADIETDIEQV